MIRSTGGIRMQQLMAFPTHGNPRFRPAYGAKARPSHPLLFRRHGGVAAVMFGIGFAPITALALSLMEICTLPLATLLLVVPALALAIALACRRRSHGRLMARGFLIGIAAVACYDAVRIPFIIAGWLDDFIPRIGVMLVGESPHHAIIGYVWRYLGNGGGMGMAFVCAFTLLRPRPGSPCSAWSTPRAARCCATGFGVLVWGCLIATVGLAPRGGETLFDVTPPTLLLTLIGHLVFGYTLGSFSGFYRSALPSHRPGPSTRRSRHGRSGHR
jgi:hypothetical protein